MNELFDYIEVFYNRKRRQSSLDYLSPAAYEKAKREEANQVALAA